MFYIFIGIGLLLLVSLAYAAASGAPWVPTRKGDLERIERLAKLEGGEKFVELGCGNGRVCRHMSRLVPNAQVKGVELSLLQYLVAVVQAVASKSRARFRFQNVFSHDLSNYDVTYMFLMPETYEKIRPKLEKELKPGSRVISYVWPIPGWSPDVIDKQEGQLDLYLYKVKNC